MTAYYESTLRESLLGDIKAKLKDKFNVSLQPATADGTGPVLDIRDGTKDDMFKLQEKSEGFGKRTTAVCIAEQRGLLQNHRRITAGYCRTIAQYRMGFHGILIDLAAIVPERKWPLYIRDFSFTPMAFAIPQQCPLLRYIFIFLPTSLEISRNRGCLQQVAVSNFELIY